MHGQSGVGWDVAFCEPESQVGWVSSLFERNPTFFVGLRSKPQLTQSTLKPKVSFGK